MIELLKKIFLFIAIIALIKLLFISVYDDPKTYHSKKLAEKEFNTVFIGSSRTRFSLIPTYFDSLTNGQTKSYNFGIDAGLPPQTFDWCEEIINSKASIKYIFIELSGGLGRLPSSQENWRAFTFNGYLQGIKKKDSKEFVDYHDRLIKNFFKPLFHNQDLNYNTNVEGMKRYPKQNTSKRELLLSNQRNKMVENFEQDYKLNKEYWNRINKLIELADSKNKIVKFFIPPRLETEKELKQIAPILKRISSHHKIPLRHFDDSLYTIETSKDNFHLNYRGAKVFTKIFAEEFNK